MKKLGKEIDHYWLLTRMAAATRAGLVAAHQDGRLSQDDWSGMVQACRGCDWADGCKSWLDLDQRADVAPAPCVNRDALKALSLDAVK